MADQFSGTMLRDLSDAVDKVERTHLNNASRERLEQLRAIVLSSGKESGLPSDLKAALLEVIDLALSENPDLAKMSAGFQRLKKWDSLPGTYEAFAIDVLRAGR